MNENNFPISEENFMKELPAETPPEKVETENNLTQIKEKTMVELHKKDPPKKIEPKKNGRNKTIFIIIFMLLSISIGFQVYAFYDLRFDTEWKCIAEQCSRYVSGDEWADNFCKFENGEQICSITYQEQEIKLPIGQIDIKNMKECIEYKCVSRVLIKNAP